MEALEREWNLRIPDLIDKKITSIYFGGGTPSLLGAEFISQILQWIQRDVPYNPNETEITLEANPENITLSLMQDYAQVGINRVSIGIQTLNDSILQKLERLHNAQKAIEAVFSTAEASIHNISVDLMYDLPHQTLKIWEETLNQIKTLPIKHLSLYNLTIEPHTTFFKQKEHLQKILPDPETSLQLYKMAQTVLSSCHLKQYEISAFAHSGFQSHHNSGYWTARPFLGFGPSSFSFWQGSRFRNIAHLNRYAQQLQKDILPIDFEEKLNPEASLRELFTINLRLIEGVDLTAFTKTHGSLDSETISTLKLLQNKGFLEEKTGVIRLTDQGILFYDTVASELI